MSVAPLYPGIPPLAPTKAAESVQTTESRTKVIDQGAFSRELNSRIAVPAEKVNFSKHATKRLDMRGIHFTPQGLDRISDAIDVAKSKGSRDALVMAGGNALVVKTSLIEMECPNFLKMI